MAGDVASCLCEVASFDLYNISLGEHIFNYAGHLLPNIFGEPTTIPIDKHFPVPHAVSTEPGERDGFRWWLDLSRSQKCGGNRPIADGYRLSNDEPLACTALANITTTLFYSENRDTTAYYRVSMYAEKDCRESSLLKVLEEFDTGRGDIGSLAGAVKVERKWNWV